MGYRGKLREREQARRLRALGWTVAGIAGSLHVARSSVSVWVRDVEFQPQLPLPPRGRRRTPNALQRRKAEEIERLLAEGRERIGQLTEQEFLVAGAALYAGEGGKTDGEVCFPNSDPEMIAFFCAWLRHFFAIDESRLRLRLYIHEGLDLDAATAFWSGLTRIPLEQFHAPYRAKPDPTIRTAKHPLGCPSVRYTCVRTHRAVMGLVRALLASDAHSGVAQSAEQGPVKPKVVGPSPTPGAPPAG